MKIVSWETRQPGDLFFSDLSSVLGEGIHKAELALHPAYSPNAFIPTHAGIIGATSSEYPEGTVIEAYEGLVDNLMQQPATLRTKWENSVAAINSSNKYTLWAAKGLVEVWRTAAAVSDTAIQTALAKYIKTYGPERYGWLNLLGFEWVALVKELTGVDISNPIHVSNVCSQGQLLFLGNFLAPNVRPYLDWANLLSADVSFLTNFEPLGARILYMEHKTQ